MPSQSQRRPLVELPLERFVQGHSSSTSKSKSITHAQSSLHTFTRHSRIPSSESDSWLSPSESKVAVPTMFKSPESLANLGLSWSPPESIGGRVPRGSPLRRSFAATQVSEPPTGGRFGTLGRVLYASDDLRAGSKVIPHSKIASSSSNTPMSPLSATPCPLAPSPEIKSCNPRSSSNGPEGVSDFSSIVIYSSNPNIPDAQLTPKRRVRATSPSSRHYPGFDVVRDSPSRSAARLATSSTTMGSESAYDEDEDKENALSLPSRRPRGSKRKMEPIVEGSLELTNDMDRAEVQRNLDPEGRPLSPWHSSLRTLRPNGDSQF